ncbi:MAG: protocatechuate 3,4-dioxygenase, partial [Thaumarchaeota archaeon]|nr:protocatechuate 3,4-dioxygenase [Nitrososphaerota archaeon]
MAKLVTAIACTHNPLIFWNNSDVEQRLQDAFDPVRKRLADTNPDALIVVANDHVMNFFLDNIPSFAIGIAPQTEGSFIGDRERG